MPTLAEHVTKAVRQFQKGDKIGRRVTPVISFWDMKPKWEKWGEAWAYIGSDGDADCQGTGSVIVPAMLQLVYFKTHNGRVCQLAYVIHDEVSGQVGSPGVESAFDRFLRLRAVLPTRLPL